MNSTWPGCIRSYSIAIGSLTFKISSACSQTSSELGAILAPAAANSSSVMDEPRPASDCTITSCPCRVNSFTPAGVMATRYSWLLTSLGTPTFMDPPDRTWAISLIMPRSSRPPMDQEARRNCRHIRLGMGCDAAWE